MPVQPTPSADSAPAIVCPTRDQWRGYALGDIAEEAIGLLSEHLESCSACERLLAEMESEVETEFAPLREAAHSTGIAAGETLDGLQVLLEGVLARDPFPPAENIVAEPKLPPPCEGSQLGPYRLLEKLGEGGMGRVYLARHEHTGRRVALKLLKHRRWHDPGQIARFRREMLAAGSVEHRSVVQALDAGEIEGQLYLAMEYVRGRTFAQLVVERVRLPVSTACKLAAQAAEALIPLHGRGVVHRDLKPSNLMLLGDDDIPRDSAEVKILDLGLARLYDTLDGDETSSGTILGTADYMAPEQALDSRAADARSDIYSLGCTLYCLLHGEPPFADPRYATFTQKAMAHVHVRPASLHELHSDIPPVLSAMVARMIAKQPADRFQSAAEVAAALASFATDSAEIGSSHARRTRGHWPWIAVGVFGVAAVAIAFARLPATLFAPHETPPPIAAPEEVPGLEKPHDEVDAPPAAEPPQEETPRIPAEIAAISERVIAWPVAAGGNGHFYLLVEQTVLWSNAQALAGNLAPQGYRSYLVSLTTPEENAFVANRLFNQQPVWIGLTDNERYGGTESSSTADPSRKGWHWLSGEAVDFTSWGPGRPHHFNEQDFVFMYLGGAWDDGDDFGLHYIVEIELLAADGADPQ